MGPQGTGSTQNKQEHWMEAGEGEWGSRFEEYELIYGKGLEQVLYTYLLLYYYYAIFLC